nr:MFS transporter [Bradyrhizobium sp. CSA207]
MASRSPSSSRIWPLFALNFFMADMQSGIGPFVGVFLQERGWASGLIGTAMTIGNVAGMLITTPIGGFIDASRNKRLWVVIPGICVVAASAIILISQNFWAVTFSQVAQSLASAAIVPAVTGITLGIAKQKGFNALNGRNRHSIMPATWSARRCRAIWATNWAMSPCSCWRRCSAPSRLAAC